MDWVKAVSATTATKATPAGTHAAAAAFSASSLELANALTTAVKFLWCDYCFQISGVLAKL